MSEDACSDIMVSGNKKRGLQSVQPNTSAVGTINLVVPPNICGHKKAFASFGYKRTHNTLT